MSTRYLVTVFAEAGYPGNSASVTLGQPVPDPALSFTPALFPDPTLFPDPPPLTQCFAWQELNTPAYRVQCFHGEYAIQCCGHGLLAVAAVLGQRQTNRQEPIWLYSCGQPLSARFDGDLVWVSFPRLDNQPCEVPSWCADAFDGEPVRAAIAGGSQGYWVLEWPAFTALEQLPVNFQVIEQQTQRAVIVTRAGSDNGVDFYLRYFAPQYGQPEDSVTGSANRILASYWQHRLGRSQFRAVQSSITIDKDSVSGGIVYSRITDNRVDIGGQVRLD